MVVLGQIVRGILFGIVIWWIKDSIIGKRLAQLCLKSWKRIFLNPFFCKSHAE